VEISVDISIFALPSASVGMISGKIDLPMLPRIGETLSFMCNENDTPFPVNSGFDGLLRVEDVLYSVGYKLPPSLMLGEIEASSVDQAITVGKYFEVAFGLNFDQFLDS
jgi:hypothetical protein